MNAVHEIYRAVTVITASLIATQIPLEAAHYWKFGSLCNPLPFSTGDRMSCNLLAAPVLAPIPLDTRAPGLAGLAASVPGSQVDVVIWHDATLDNDTEHEISAADPPWWTGVEVDSLKASLFLTHLSGQHIDFWHSENTSASSINIEVRETPRESKTVGSDNLDAPLNETSTPHDSIDGSSRPDLHAPRLRWSLILLVLLCQTVVFLALPQFCRLTRLDLACKRLVDRFSVLNVLRPIPASRIVSHPTASASALQPLITRLRLQISELQHHALKKQDGVSGIIYHWSTLTRRRRYLGKVVFEKWTNAVLRKKVARQAEQIRHLTQTTRADDGQNTVLNDGNQLVRERREAIQAKSSLEAEVRRLSKRCGDLEVDILREDPRIPIFEHAALEREANSLRASNERLKESKKTLEQDVDSWKKRCVEVESALGSKETMDKTVEECDQLLKEQHELINSQRGRIESLQAQTREDRATIQDQADALTAAYAVAEDDNAEERDNAMQAERQSFESRLQSLQTELDRALAENSQLEAISKRDGEERNSREAGLQEMRSENAQLIADASRAAHKDSNAERQKAIERIKQLEDALIDDQSTMKSMKDLNQSLAQDLQDQRQLNKELEESKPKEPALEPAAPSFLQESAKATASYQARTQAEEAMAAIQDTFGDQVPESAQAALQAIRHSMDTVITELRDVKNRNRGGRKKKKATAEASAAAKGEEEDNPWAPPLQLPTVDTYANPLAGLKKRSKRSVKSRRKQASATASFEAIATPARKTLSAPATSPPPLFFDSEGGSGPDRRRAKSASTSPLHPSPPSFSDDPPVQICPLCSYLPERNVDDWQEAADWKVRSSRASNSLSSSSDALIPSGYEHLRATAYTYGEYDEPPRSPLTRFAERSSRVDWRVGPRIACSIVQSKVPTRHLQLLKDTRDPGGLPPKHEQHRPIKPSLLSPHKRPAKETDSSQTPAPEATSTLNAQCDPNFQSTEQEYSQMYYQYPSFPYPVLPMTPYSPPYAPESHQHSPMDGQAGTSVPPHSGPHSALALGDETFQAGYVSQYPNEFEQSIMQTSNGEWFQMGRPFSGPVIIRSDDSDRRDGRARNERG